MVDNLNEEIDLEADEENFEANLKILEEGGA